jgi:DNA-binding transcriptional LysR family regulator
LPDRLTALEVFTRIVETGSFTLAAAELNLSRGAVSKHMTVLEDRLGVRLLNRTTRRSSLTEAGTAFYERCRQLLADLEEAELQAGQAALCPRGVLKISAPMSFGIHHLAPALPDYLRAYPEVTVDLALNDRVVDLVDEGFDVAIRIRRLDDSSLIARRIAPCRMVVCAAPAYLAARGEPRVPADLARHDCLAYTYAARGDVWEFTGPEGVETVRVTGRFRANNGDALGAAAAAGYGIIIQPTFIVSDQLASGVLRPILTDYRLAESSIFAVWPPGRHVSAKLRSFVDFLAARFGPEPYWDRWRERSATTGRALATAP